MGNTAYSFDRMAKLKDPTHEPSLSDKFEDALLNLDELTVREMLEAGYQPTSREIAMTDSLVIGAERRYAANEKVDTSRIEHELFYQVRQAQSIKLLIEKRHQLRPEKPKEKTPEPKDTKSPPENDFQRHIRSVDQSAIEAMLVGGYKLTRTDIETLDQLKRSVDLGTIEYLHMGPARKILETCRAIPGTSAALPA